jgi:Spy/CpxP family protein refolding chaperone
MRNKKRFMVVGGILLAVVLAGSAVVEAWGPGGWLGRGGGCGGWFHHGFRGGKNMSDFVLRRLDEKVNALNLTATQKEKYNEFRTSIKTHLSEAIEDRRALRESLHAEMAKEIPDVAGLTERMKMKIQEVSGAMQKNLDLFAAFYGNLDNNQKKQLVSEIQERMSEYGRERDRMAP